MKHKQESKTLDQFDALIETAKSENQNDILAILYIIKSAFIEGPETWEHFQEYVSLWAKKRIFEIKN